MILEIFLWLLIIEFFAFLSLPIVIKFFYHFKDKGFCAAKLIGIFLTSYLTWVFSFFLGFNINTIFLSVALFLTLSFVLFIREKDRILNELIDNKNTFFQIELLFLLLFHFFLFLRVQTPEILTLEKFMDFAFLNAIIKSTRMPPLDPWYAGGYINYYYFGYFITAVLTKISGFKTSITYNLMFATYYAIFSLLVFSLLFNLTKKYVYGLLGIVVIAILGNSFGIIQLFTFAFPQTADYIAKVLDLEYPISCCWNPKATFEENLKAFSLWPSTRIIPNSINEFPFASFLFGDLHPHYMGFSFQVLVLLFLLNIFKCRYRRTLDLLYLSLALALIMGALSIINTWDYFSYVFLLLLITLFTRKREIIIISTLTIIFSLLLFSPFYISFHPPQKEISTVKERTNPLHLVIIFSFPLFTISYFLLKQSPIKSKNLFFVFISIGVLSLGMGIPTAVILIPILLLSLLLAKEEKSVDNKFILLLTITATLLLLFTDIIYLESRMNTIFKLFLEVWILYGIASVYFLCKMEKSKTVVIVIVLLVIINLITPFFVTLRHVHTETEKTLDGTIYLKRLYPEEYKAISWINENIEKGKIILEAPGRAYTFDSRVSANTGLPTVIGWVNHEFIWRGKWFTERERDVNTIYNTTNNTLTLSLLKKYNVTYIYVGDVEKQRYSIEGLRKFDIYENYKLVYSNGVKIYQVFY